MRLGLTLNYSVFLHDTRKRGGQAMCFADKGLAYSLLSTVSKRSSCSGGKPTPAPYAPLSGLRAVSATSNLSFTRTFILLCNTSRHVPGRDRSTEENVQCD